MSRIACHLLPVGLLLPAAALLAAAPVPDVPDRRPPHQVEAAQQLLARLKKEAAAPQVDVDALWKLWQRMRLEHGGSPECLAAAAVMSKAPSPLDKLDRNQIPAEDRLPWLPKEVVAVLGEHRGRGAGGRGGMFLSPDSKYLLVNGKEGVHVWDSTTLRQEKFFPGLKILAQSPEGRVLAAIAKGGGLQLCTWDGSKLTLGPVLRGQRMPKRKREYDRRADQFRKDSGYKPNANAARFGAAGKTLIVLTSDDVLRVWDLSDRVPAERSVIDAGPMYSHGICFPGSNLVAEAVHGKKDDDLILWELSGGTLHKRAELASGQDPLALSPDGRTLATRMRRLDGIRLWDISGEAPRAISDCLLLRVWARALAFSPDGKVLAAAYDDGTLRFWPLDEAARKQLKLGPQETHRRYALRVQAHGLLFYPDGKTLALECRGGLVSLWDMEKEKERFEPRGHIGAVSALAFAPDGKSLVSGGIDGTLRRWDLTGTKPRERAVVRGRGEGIRSVAFAPQGGHVVATQEPPSRVSGTPRRFGDLRLWELAGDDLKAPILSPPGRGGDNYLAFSPDGRWFAATGGEVPLGLGRSDPYREVPVVNLWQIHRGDLRVVAALHPRTLKAEEDHYPEASSPSFSPDGKLLAFVVGRPGNRVGLWDVSKLPAKERAVLRLDNWQPSSLEFSPDGKTLAVRGEELGEDGLHVNRAWLWDVGRPNPRSRFELKELTDVRFSPDGRTAASFDEKSRLILWEVATGRRLRSVQLPPWVGGVVFAPDGRHMATLNGNGTVYVLRIGPVAEGNQDRRPVEKR